MFGNGYPVLAKIEIATHLLHTKLLLDSEGRNRQQVS